MNNGPFGFAGFQLLLRQSFDAAQIGMFKGRSVEKIDSSQGSPRQIGSR